MEWAQPVYSRTKVNRAGEALRALPDVSNVPSEILDIISNWRASHAMPLEYIRTSLKGRAKRVEDDVIVAHRLKRLTSIHDKLVHFENMTLTGMQDIGGCRAIFDTSVGVYELLKQYERYQTRYKVGRVDDYIDQPKQSGYRGVHLVLRYSNERHPQFNGLKIELQLRSYLQHIWATALETVETFIHQPLKAGRGDENWLKLFQLMSSYLALQELDPLVPGTPHDERALCRAIQELDSAHDFEGTFVSIDILAQQMEAHKHDESFYDGYYLFSLFTLESQTPLYMSFSLKERRAAIEMLRESEDDGIPTALVSAGSLADLRMAYPNYFNDTVMFHELLRRALDTF